MSHAIGSSACLGLSKAHEVKLLDFGIAKVRVDPFASAEAVALTSSGSMLGSPHYTSPEQANGDKDIDYRTDIWSLGIAL